MKTILVLLLLMLSNMMYALAAPAPLNEIEDSLFNKLSTENVNNFIKKTNQELNSDMPLLNMDFIKKAATGGIYVDREKIKAFVVNKLAEELRTNAHLMGKLLFLAVLCAMMQNMQNSFEYARTSALAYSLCFIFMAVIALTAFNEAVSLVKQTVGYMVGFMEALLPLLISLLAGVGALTSAALLTPVMLFTITSISLIIQNIVLPLLLLTALLECTNFFTDKYKLSNLSGLLKQAGLFIMGITMVIFIGIITIQGAAGSVADGLTLRTAKFATASFIPVVGKMFADTVELVMGASLLMKNAIGLFGVTVIVLICILPVVKLLTLVVMIKMSGALIQPMGDEKMAKFLDVMSNNLLLLFAAVLMVALMFFLAITMIVATGSAAMMLR